MAVYTCIQLFMDDDTALVIKDSIEHSLSNNDLESASDELVVSDDEDTEKSVESKS